MKVDDKRRGPCLFASPVPYYEEKAAEELRGAVHSMSYPLTDIDGIDADVARALKRVGVRTTAALLEAAKDSKGRKALAGKTQFDEKLLLKWANVADRMRIKGIGAEYAELIHAAGVDTVRELKHRNAKRLAAAMKAANEKRKLVQFLPSDKAVAKWIDQAKKLPLKISY